MPTMARTSLSKFMPAGRNSGNTTEAMNSTEISGTLRRIEAVHQQAEASADHGPAGARFDAGLPRGSRAPICRNDRPIDQGRDNDIDDVGGQHRQQRIERRGEEVLAQPAEDANLGYR